MMEMFFRLEKPMFFFFFFRVTVRENDMSDKTVWVLVHKQNYRSYRQKL